MIGAMHKSNKERPTRDELKYQVQMVEHNIATSVWGESQILDKLSRLSLELEKTGYLPLATRLASFVVQFIAKRNKGKLVVDLRQFKLEAMEAFRAADFIELVNQKDKERSGDNAERKRLRKAS